MNEQINFIVYLFQKSLKLNTVLIAIFLRHRNLDKVPVVAREKDKPKPAFKKNLMRTLL